jgi:hypothetical protein
MSASSSNPRRYWRPNAANGTRPPSSRLLRLVLLAVCVLALAGVIAGLLTLIRPHHRAYFLPLAIDQYGESFPFRRWVQQDKEALCSLPWQQQGETFTLQRRSLIEDQLKKLAERPAQDTVVVYLSGYVRTREKGELSLIPVDGELDDQNTWIPLDEVFKRLRVCPAAHKLLLLDVMQPCIDLEKGLLNNNAAYLLQPLLEEKTQHDAKLSVLTACAPGQVSHTSEELGRSVFAHFLYLGLSGMADGATSKVKDRFVSLGELAAYVSAEVDQWAARYRGTRQTPRLYGFGASDVKGRDADFRLVRYEPRETPEPAPLSRDYPTELLEGWALRDRWLYGPDARPATKFLPRLEGALLTAEQQWRDGIALAKVKSDLLQPVLDVSPPLPARRAVDLSEERSVAAAVARSQPWKVADQDALRTGLRRLLDLVSTPKPNTEQIEGMTEKWVAKLKGKPLELAWLVLELAGEEELRPVELKFLVTLLGKQNVPDVVETKLLREWAEVTAPPPDWPAEGIRLAVQTVRLLEQAETFEPAELEWVGIARKGATGLFEEGKKGLFAPTRKVRMEAPGMLAKALKDAELIVEDLRQIREARQVRDEALLLLPTYVGYLEVDDRLEKNWVSASRTACELRKNLAAPPAIDPAERVEQIKTITSLAQQLRNGANALNVLRKTLETNALRDVIRRCSKGELADAAIVAKAWLNTPWPDSKQRLELWKAWRVFDDAVTERRSGRLDLAPLPTAADIGAENRRALHRAHWSIELLRLLGQNKLENLEKSLESAAGQPGESLVFRQLTRELRQAWLLARKFDK